MTAIAVIRSDDGIVFASDGSVCDAETGVLIAQLSKVVLLPELPCVIAQRGVAGFVHAVRFRLSYVRDFDDILERIVPVASACFSETLSEAPNVPPTSLFLGGWSELRQQFEAYRIGSREIDAAQPDGSTLKLPAFALNPVPVAYAAPMPDAEQIKAAGISWESSSIDDDAVTVLKVVCAARQSPGDSFPSVGSFLQLTVLGRDGVYSKVVHRWPDVLGERIDPTRGEPFPLL